MEIEVIGVPLYYGCDNPGTEQAYDTFLNHGLVERINGTGHIVGRTEKVLVPPEQDKWSSPLMKHRKQVLEACRNLEQAVDQCLTRGNFPFVLGGDHALGIGSLAGVSRHCSRQDLTVIWVDAHTDINTEQTSGSHNIHGMPLAACLGLGDSQLREGLSSAAPFFLPENLLYFGSRSVDEGEEAIMKEQGILPVRMNTIRSLGMGEAVRRLLERVKTPWIHISFDVDFMDAGEFSATGLPIPDGPSVADTALCLQMLLSDSRVRSMDFVEYSPIRDQDGKGLADCMTLIETGFRAMRLRD